MAARRLLILMLVLLAVSTVAAALVPPQGDDEGTTARTRTEPTKPGRHVKRTPPGRLVERTIRVAPHGIARVHVRLDDQLALTVRSGVADQVSIPAFGQIEDLTPEAPARFDLLAEQAGVFEVRLVQAKRTIGRIAVTSDKSGTGAKADRKR
jgi:hypothetical protein